MTPIQQNITDLAQQLSDGDELKAQDLKERISIEMFGEPYEQMSECQVKLIDVNDGLVVKII